MNCFYVTRELFKSGNGTNVNGHGLFRISMFLPSSMCIHLIPDDELTVFRIMGFVELPFKKTETNHLKS